MAEIRHHKGTQHRNILIKKQISTRKKKRIICKVLKSRVNILFIITANLQFVKNLKSSYLFVSYFRRYFIVITRNVIARLTVSLAEMAIMSSATTSMRRVPRGVRIALGPPTLVHCNINVSVA